MKFIYKRFKCLFSLWYKLLEKIMKNALFFKKSIYFIYLWVERMLVKVLVLFRLIVKMMLFVDC